MAVSVFCSCREGVIGNSPSSESGMDPSWYIVGQVDENLVNAAVNTTDTAGALDDFRFRFAQVCHISVHYKFLQE